MTTRSRHIYIAGKNDIACRALDYLIRGLRYPIDFVKVIPNPEEPERHTWQYSLSFTARSLGVEIVPISRAYNDPQALFISLEYSKIISPHLFASNSLYNIHFSKLPAYRGVGMAIWPILRGEMESGVTLHRIDAGIDSGEIVDQIVFDLPIEWTARDLYQAFLDNGFELFQRNINSLLDNSAISRSQPVVGASYFRRSLLDYSALQVDFRRTAYEVHNQIRAYSFWEYQLPIIAGRKVLRSALSDRHSSNSPGHVSFDSRNHGFVSTVDWDVELFFSPYDDLWLWASGDVDDIPDFVSIPDVDRQNAQGWSAAMMAAYHCRADRLRVLLQNGIDVNQCNRRGTTLFMYAKSGCEKCGDMSCLKLLLSKGVNVNAIDAMGKNVIDYLEIEGRDDLVKFILGGVDE